MDDLKELFADEQKQEEKQEKPVNMFDYVTIPVKEYRKMIRKIERIKAEKDALVQINEAKEKAEDYRRWWHSEQDRSKKLEEALEDAKDQLKNLLGVSDEKKEEE